VHAGAVTNREEIEDNSIPISTQVEIGVVRLRAEDQAGERGMADYPSSLRSSRSFAARRCGVAGARLGLARWHVRLC